MVMVVMPGGGIDRHKPPVYQSAVMAAAALLREQNSLAATNRFKLKRL
jgi:hypothetical protein